MSAVLQSRSHGSNATRKGEADQTPETGDNGVDGPGFGSDARSATARCLSDFRNLKIIPHRGVYLLTIACHNPPRHAANRTTMTKIAKRIEADTIAAKLEHFGFKAIYGLSKGHGWKTISQCRKLTNY